jgi:L-rhamnonate dehydratase
MYQKLLERMDADMKITSVKGTKVTRIWGLDRIGNPYREDQMGMPANVYPDFMQVPDQQLMYKRADGEPERYIVQDAILEIYTDEGITGLTNKAHYLEQIKGLAPHLLGRNPLSTETIWDILYRLNGFPNGQFMSALATIDIALYDLKCKAFDVSLSTLLGGPTRSDIPAYAMARDFSKEPAMVYKRSKEFAEQGFEGIKWYPKYGPAHGTEGMKKNLAFLTACREGGGKDFKIMIDCWKSWSVSYAIEMLHLLRDVGIYWLEEPVAQRQFDSYRKIREKAGSVRITGGEQLYTIDEFKQLLDHEAVDIVQPDPVWCGGITQIRKILDLAAAYDVPAVMHVVQMIVNAQLSGAYSPAQVPMIEYPVFNQKSRAKRIFAKDGRVPVDDNPGIFRLDEDEASHKEVLFEVKL